jgi:uncharacterized membrane protein
MVEGRRPMAGRRDRWTGGRAMASEAGARNGHGDGRETLGRTSNADVGTVERAASALGGGALTLFGLSRRGPAGLALAAAGGWLLYRGATGRDPVYRALGINTSDTNPGPRAVVQHKEGIKVARSVTVDRPAAELYRFWRDFHNLPRIMAHLESVEMLDENRSRWVATAPGGRTVEWEAEIITERENELIGWRSLEGAEVANAGSVRFRPAPGGRGTEIHVTLTYDPPLGHVGSAIASLFGEEPNQQVREDLRHFKQMVETGEIAVGGWPSGRDRE